MKNRRASLRSRTILLRLDRRSELPPSPAEPDAKHRDAFPPTPLSLSRGRRARHIAPSRRRRRSGRRGRVLARNEEEAMPKHRRRRETQSSARPRRPDGARCLAWCPHKKGDGAERRGSAPSCLPSRTEKVEVVDQVNKRNSCSDLSRIPVSVATPSSPYALLTSV